MKVIIIAALLGLFLSTPAGASSADQALQMRSNSSQAASGYTYVNRLDAPGGHTIGAGNNLVDR